MKNWLLARLSEPSTYAGIGLFFTQVAHALTGDPVAIAGVLASIGAVVKSEKSGA